MAEDVEVSQDDVKGAYALFRQGQQMLELFAKADEDQRASEGILANMKEYLESAKRLLKKDQVVLGTIEGIILHPEKSQEAGVSYGDTELVLQRVIGSLKAFIECWASDEQWDRFQLYGS